MLEISYLIVLFTIFYSLCCIVASFIFWIKYRNDKFYNILKYYFLQKYDKLKIH